MRKLDGGRFDHPSVRRAPRVRRIGAPKGVKVSRAFGMSGMGVDRPAGPTYQRPPWLFSQALRLCHSRVEMMPEQSMASPVAKCRPHPGTEGLEVE